MMRFTFMKHRRTFEWLLSISTTCLEYGGGTIFFIDLAWMYWTLEIEFRKPPGSDPEGTND